MSNVNRKEDDASARAEHAPLIEVEGPDRYHLMPPGNSATRGGSIAVDITSYRARWASITSSRRGRPSRRGRREISLFLDHEIAPRRTQANRDRGSVARRPEKIAEI